MTPKRVIYHGFTEGKESIINYLHGKYGWEPIIIFGSSCIKII